MEGNIWIRGSQRVAYAPQMVNSIFKGGGGNMIKIEYHLICMYYIFFSNFCTKH